MNNILFIGHAYHQVTRSSEFFLDILEQLGPVERVFDDSLDNGHEKKQYRQKAICGGYSLIVVWQLEYVAKQLVDLDNVVFVPMFDGCRNLPTEFWESLRGMRVLALSISVYERAQAGGCQAEYCQYWPEPDALFRDEGREDSAYFWYRRNDVSRGIVEQIVNRHGISDLCVLWKPDPAEKNSIPKERFLSIGARVSFVPWSQSRNEQHEIIRQSSFYIASRHYEGIGMSFLEAMAMGRCVVAPRNPTYTDYIVSGYNGILYDKDYAGIYSPEQIRQIRKNAWQSAVIGRKRWEAALPRLSSWLVTGKPFEFYGFGNPLLAQSSISNSHQAATKPLLTVATVVRNAGEALGATIENVLSQRGISFEYIILDGASTDNTLEVAKRYMSRVSRIVSEPDKGIYDAMNKAALIATGEYIFFMNAGDKLANDTALSDMMAEVTGGPDIVIGHHIFLRSDGVVKLHRAADFKETYERLSRGALSNDWHSGIPCHQATITRTSLLRELKYDPTIFVAADHDLMFRAAARGAHFELKNLYVCIYEGGGFSSLKQYDCVKQWLGIGLRHSQTPEAVYRFYSKRLLKPFADRLISSKNWGEGLKFLWRERSVVLPALRSLKRRDFNRYLKSAVSSSRSHLLGLFHRDLSLEGAAPRSANQRAGLVLRGFSDPEDAGRWTEEPHAEISLKEGAAAARRLVLVVTRLSSYAKEHPVAVEVNGQPLGLIRLRKGKNSIFLPSRTVIKRIQFGFPNVLSPAELGTGADTRRLGIMLKRISIPRW